MNKKIAILRGINVGGKRKIRMRDLKSLCENLGWKDVETYIQSGNLIFSSDDQNSELEETLELEIQKFYGFDVPVIVRNSKELQTSIANNPFIDTGGEINQLHLTFLKDRPIDEKVEQIWIHSYAPDKFKIVGKDVFIFCAGKYHKSKLTNNFFERKLNTGATTRNWKTVLKLAEMIETTK